MQMALFKQKLRRFLHSKTALAVPVTFLILFVSTMGIISVTYAFSVQKVNSQSQLLKVSTAKGNFLSLNDAVLSTLWQPGSSSTYDLADSGGQLNVQPVSNVLTINVSGGSEIAETVFNASIGMVIYELPSSSSSQSGLYLKGDSRTITNQSGSSMSQMCIQTGAEHPEIQLRYRPSLTYTVAGLEDGKTVNNIRIYIANLNGSDSIALQGKLPLQISCKSTQLMSCSFQASSAIDRLVVTSVLDGAVGSVSVPVSSTSQGAVVHVETVVCNVAIERWIL